MCHTVTVTGNVHTLPVWQCCIFIFYWVGFNLNNGDNNRINLCWISSGSFLTFNPVESVKAPPKPMIDWYVWLESRVKVTSPGNQNNKI